MAPESESKFMRALEHRTKAIDRVFGEQELYLASPIPFYLGGDPTIIAYSKYLKDRTVYCTSEMTGGWGSGQLPGPLGEYEFVMVLPKESKLGPRSQPGGLFAKGWCGVSLTGFCKYSCQVVMRHGETSGPLPEAFKPHTQFLFVELANGRIKFEFDGERYGLLLMMSISEAEYQYLRQHDAEALLKLLRKKGAFPVTDPSRASVV